MAHDTPPWTVTFSNRAEKQKQELPDDIQDILLALVAELEWEGPDQTEWTNYGKLLGRKKGQDYRHCHLNKGKPRYVAIWRVQDMELQLMEIRYVGTHEKANYGRIH